MTHTTTGTNATIVSIAETMQITDKFKKKEFVVKMGDTYPQFVKFELTQLCDLVKKTDLIMRIKQFET